MAQHHIVEWIGVITLFLFGITMICQGHFIYHGKRGYKYSERESKRSEDTRRQIEEMLKDK